MRNFIVFLLAIIVLSSCKEDKNLAEGISTEDNTIFEEPVIVKQYGFNFDDFTVVQDTVAKNETFGELMTNNKVDYPKIYSVSEKFKDYHSFASSKLVDILPTEIEAVKKDTYLNDTFTPFELYIKFLIEYFGKSIEYDPESITDLPKGYKKLAYQMDAVNDGYAKLFKHDGFILADVVGLGKTIIATIIDAAQLSTTKARIRTFDTPGL